MKYNFIVAVDKDWGIAKDNKLPFAFSKDMQYFRRLTIGNYNNAIVMGRATWDTLLFTPLSKRVNFVFSKTKQIDKKDNYFVTSLTEFKTKIKQFQFDNVFIIGGAKIYNLFQTELIDKIYITHIDKSYGCDLFFPIKKEELKLFNKNSVKENGVMLNFSQYKLKI